MSKQCGKTDVARGKKAVEAIALVKAKAPKTKASNTKIFKS